MTIFYLQSIFEYLLYSFGSPMKLHFTSSIIFVIVLTLLTINNNLNERMLLLVIVMIFFYATFIIFGYELEKQKRLSWKKKEKKLIEETYSKFVIDFYKKKKIT